MPVCLIWKHLLRMVSPRGQLNVVWPKSLKPPARILFCFSNQFLRLPLLCPCGHNLRASTFRILHLTQWSQHRKTSRAKHEGKRERWISPRLLLCRVWPALYEFSPTPPFSLPSPAYPLLVHGANRFPQCRTSLKRCCISCHSFFFFFLSFLTQAESCALEGGICCCLVTAEKAILLELGVIFQAGSCLCTGQHVHSQGCHWHWGNAFHQTRCTAVKLRWIWSLRSVVAFSTLCCAYFLQHEPSLVIISNISFSHVDL